MSTLRQQATKGMFWSFIDQFISQGISFVLGIILARILLPADYGLIGMLGIFIAIANSFINSGFGTALIQKKDRNETDFSTVFFFNMAVSVIFYFILFFAAPYIASFYNAPLLESVTKVVAINFVINALMIVPRTKLNINVDFKTQTKISFVSVIISGLIGVSMAYLGYGVWSLVFQSLTATASQSILYFYFIRWKPSFVFSKTSFKDLFGFGSKLLVSGLLDTVYNNIYSLVIGKKFSAADLGYYSRAQQLESLPASNVTFMLQRVTFPILCSIQDDNARLIEAYRKLIRMAAFIIFPLMFLLVLIAQPLVILLLTEKWLPMVGLFQILCFSGMWYPIHAINLNLLQAKGRSDLFLRLEIIKKIMGITVLIITIPIGLKAMVIGQVVTSFLALFMNTYYTGKYFNYGIFAQLKDIFAFLFIAISLCGILVFTQQFISSNWIKIITGTFAYGIIYWGISRIFKFEEIKTIQPIIIKFVSKLFNNK